MYASGGGLRQLRSSILKHDSTNKASVDFCAPRLHWLTLGFLGSLKANTACQHAIGGLVSAVAQFNDIKENILYRNYRNIMQHKVLRSGCVCVYLELLGCELKCRQKRATQPGLQDHSPSAQGNTCWSRGGDCNSLLMCGA